MAYSENQLVQTPPHHQLMSEAKNALSGRWGVAVPAYLIFNLIISVVGIIPFLPVLIAGPLSLGLSMFGLKFIRDQDPEIGNIFDGFKNFGNALAAYLLMVLVISLGVLFFIIPGIILGLGLSQTMYILADEPDIGPVEALKKSWEMMKGHKTDYFILGLRFIPWALLCILTLFIGFLWLAPYMLVTYANYYESIKFADDLVDDDISRHLVE